MRIMRKMNSAFSFVRACMIVTVACNISVAMFCWAYCHFFNVRQNDRIYRLTGERLGRTSRRTGRRRRRLN